MFKVTYFYSSPTSFPYHCIIFISSTKSKNNYNNSSVSNKRTHASVGSVLPMSTNEFIVSNSLQVHGRLPKAVFNLIIHPTVYLSALQTAISTHQALVCIIMSKYVHSFYPTNSIQRHGDLNSTIF